MSTHALQRQEEEGIFYIRRSVVTAQMYKNMRISPSFCMKLPDIYRTPNTSKSTICSCTMWTMRIMNIDVELKEDMCSDQSKCHLSLSHVIVID